MSFPAQARGLSIGGCCEVSPDYIRAGRVRPLISKTYPMHDIAWAQEDFHAKRYPGKLVLLPPKGTT